MDAEEILSKHTGETGIYLTKGMIRGSDALEAMEEHTSMRLEEKEKEINRLENILNEGLTNNVQMVEEISSLQSELEGLKQILRETASRANVIMPTEDDEVEWFEQQFHGAPYEFMRLLFELTGHGKAPQNIIETLQENEKIGKEIESAVYGECPKCKENMTRCSCHLPSIDEILRRGDAIKKYKECKKENENKPRNSVDWFAKQMERKLKLNDHKGGWKNCELQYLSMRLTQERKELTSAIEEKDFQKIINECADIANFAMMIADKFGPEFGK